MALRPGQTVDGARVVGNDELPTLIPHLTFDQAQLVVLPGQRGNGKTWTEEQYIEVREPRVLVITPRQDDFQLVQRSPDIDSALADLALGVPCRRRVALDIDRIDFDDSGEAPDLDTYEFGREVMTKCAQRLRGALLVLSEVHLWSPYKAGAITTLLVTQSRHYGIRLMVDSQRIGLVPDIFLSEATHMAIFKIGRRPRDREVIEEWCGEDIAEKSQQLAPRQALLLDL